MFNIKKIFIIFIIIPWTFAYSSVEQLRQLNQSLKNEYPGFVESRYEYFLNNYFSQRVDETRIMTQTILEKSQQALEELNSAQIDLNQREGVISSADALHVQNNLSHLKFLESEIKKNDMLLKRIGKVVAAECSEDRLQGFHQIHNPVKLYSIPVHSIEYDEPAKVNTSVYFQGNYQFETGNSNFEKSSISSGLTEDQQQIAAVGGVVVGGVFCALTAGLSCEPTTFSIASAIGTAVIGAIFTAFNTAGYVSERNAYIDDVKSIYNEMNSLIQRSNKSVQDKSWRRLNDVCQGFFYSAEGLSVEGYVAEVQNKFQENSKSFSEQMETFVEKAGKYLDSSKLQTHDQFRFYEFLSADYEQSIMTQMEALFELVRSRQHEAQTTFVTEVIPALADYKKSRESTLMPIERKLEAAHQLWNQVLIRQAKYAPAQSGFDGGLVDTQNKMLILELRKEGL